MLASINMYGGCCMCGGSCMFEACCMCGGILRVAVCVGVYWG